MANSEYLEITVDKFVFRVPRDCRYSNADVWAKREGTRVRVGMTDFLQQKSGDVGFVDVKPISTVLATDDELAAVETIKVDLVIPAPLAGAIVAVNAALAERPELVNSDPYGEGWLAEIEPTRWADFDALLDAETYLPQMKARAELEREMSDDKRVLIIPCSGIGKAYGSVGREAMYAVLEELRPAASNTVCLSLLTLGDAEAQAAVRAHSTITIDGCPKACAQINVEAAGGKPAAIYRVFDVYRAHKDLKVRSVSELGESGRKMAQILAQEIATKVDALQAMADSHSAASIVLDELDETQCQSVPHVGEHLAMPVLPKKKVGLISCSGEELPEGTLSRAAALNVLERLRPNETVTLCLPLFLAGDDKERAFARFYPTIAIDGCDKRCAARATEKYSARPTVSLVIPEFLAARGLESPHTRRQLDAAGERAAEALAEEIAQRVDDILGLVREPVSDSAAPAPETEAVTATCSCGSGIPVTRLVIAGKTVEVVALPLIFEQFRGDGKSPDELMNAVQVYNSIPVELETAYREAILRAYAEPVAV